MVNGVEFAMPNHVQRVREFKNHDPGRLQKPGEPGDKIIDVVHMGDHIVGDNDIRKFPFARQSLAASRPEKIMDRGHTDRVRPGYGPIRRIDPEAVNAASGKVAQQVAVVAGDLHDKAVWTELIPADQRFDVFGGMLQQSWRGRRKIRVVTAIKNIRRHGLGHLQERACWAKCHCQRKSSFRTIEFFLAEERIRYRLGPEIEDHPQVVAAA